MDTVRDRVRFVLLLEQLAAHALALRFGDGAEGLARGVGLTVLVAQDLPAGVEVADDHDGVVALRDAQGVLTEIARHLLAPYAHSETDVRALAGVVKKLPKHLTTV